MTTPSDKSTMMFASLVALFNSQAMMAMGKVPNPMTGKIERHLPGAQAMIDMLEMIEERTRGNLTDDEQRMLSAALSDLRLNYVYEIKRDTTPPSQVSNEAVESESGDTAPDDGSIPEGAGADRSDGIPDNVA